MPPGERRKLHVEARAVLRSLVSRREIRIGDQARRIQRFLSQPFSVAQVFTGREGRQVPVAETVRGFKDILDGKYDNVPEGDFYMKGGIEDVRKS